MSSCARKPRGLPELVRQFEPDVRKRMMEGVPAPALDVLMEHFPTWSHDGQCPPPGDWRTWAIIAGRGFGKTRAGAEWVLSVVRGEWPPAPHLPPLPSAALRLPPSPLEGEGCSSVRIALVAATVDEAWRVMVEGPSGVLSLARPGEVVEASLAKRTLRFASGAEATLFSGRSPEALRGPEHDYAWCDEIAKWHHGEATWTMLQMGMRRGSLPRVLITTTPKGGPLLRKILDAPDTVETGGASYANPHLPRAFLNAMERDYAGTRLGLQEIQGRMIADLEGSLWPITLIEASRAVPQPDADWARVVVGVDPPASAGGTCGIVVCALGRDGLAHVIADHSVTGCSPEGWARAVVDAVERHGADRVIAESNQGGDMVMAVLRAASATLPVRPVHASRSKAARAEPVAALFENGRAWFAGVFPELEAQLGGMIAGGAYQGPGASPDRADAMVWALWTLMLEAKAEPRIRLL